MCRLCYSLCASVCKTVLPTVCMRVHGCAAYCMHACAWLCCSLCACVCSAVLLTVCVRAHGCAAHRVACIGDHGIHKRGHRAPKEVAHKQQAKDLHTQVANRVDLVHQQGCKSRDERGQAACRWCMRQTSRAQGCLQSKHERESAWGLSLGTRVGCHSSRAFSGVSSSASTGASHAINVAGSIPTNTVHRGKRRVPLMLPSLASSKELAPSLAQLFTVWACPLEQLECCRMV